MIIIVDRVAMFSVRCRESMWHRRCLAGPSDHTVHRSSPSLPLPPRSTALLPGEPDPLSLSLCLLFLSLARVSPGVGCYSPRTRLARVLVHAHTTLSASILVARAREKRDSALSFREPSSPPSPPRASLRTRFYLRSFVLFPPFRVYALHSVRLASFRAFSFATLLAGATKRV